MSYLSRLHTEFSEKRVPSPLTKLTEAPFVSSVSTEGTPFLGNHIADRPPPPDEAPAQSDAHLRLVSEIEERAAIVEYDGKLPRILAEALAQLEVCPPPPGTQPRRWQRAQVAFVELLATGAAVQALAAGWTLQELCGVCRMSPHDAPSKAGLIFSMWPGDRVEGIDAWGCNIAAAQRWHNWRRVPASALVVMPWEIGT